MKRKVGLGILLILVLVVLFRLIRGEWREQITIIASYMQYACGDDNIDMKVVSVDNSNYKFMIEKDIAPVTSVFTQGSLIDFVDEKTLMWQKGLGSDYLENFTLVGYFRSIKAEAGCSSAKEFVVEKIKYGKEKEFNEF